jgi:hypothetical protein
MRVGVMIVLMSGVMRALMLVLRSEERAMCEGGVLVLEKM